MRHELGLVKVEQFAMRCCKLQMITFLYVQEMCMVLDWRQLENAVDALGCNTLLQFNVENIVLFMLKILLEINELINLQRVNFRFFFFCFANISA